MKKYFFYLCLIVFFWYAKHPGLFERKLFANEVLAIIGFLIFIGNPVLYRKDDYIYNNVILILFIFLAYAVTSLLIFENFYGYLRNTVLLYSVFSFFLGTKLYEALLRVGKKDLLFLSAILPFPNLGYLPLVPLFLFRYSKLFTWQSIVLILSLLVIMAWYFVGSTPIAVILLVVSFCLLTERSRVLSMFTLAGFGAGFLIFMQPHLNIHLIDGIGAVMGGSDILRLDGNATVRFLMWSYLFFEVFPNNLFGIGFGTPMISIPFLLKAGMATVVIEDPCIEYTLGAHNSFVTVFARCGVVGLLAFICLYWRLVKDFVNDKITSKGSKVFFFYYAFVMITGVAMLNVVLESPIYASLYWGVLGMLYQAKQDLRISGANNVEA